MTNSDSTLQVNEAPWYRQFWPWFIIALPGAVVVASIFTVYLAFSNQDSLVSDNYYKEGLAINRTLEQDQLATQLGLSATLTIDNITGEVLVAIENGDGTSWSDESSINLRFIHPTSHHYDFSINLSQDSRISGYKGDLPNSINGKWQLNLSTTSDTHQSSQWRLRKKVDLNGDVIDLVM